MRFPGRDELPFVRVDRAPVGDHRAQRQLRWAIGVFGAIVLAVGTGWVAFAAYLQDVAFGALGSVAVIFAAYLVVESRISRHRSAASIATRTAIATDLAILAGVTAEPAIGIAMTMAAVIPPVLALVHVGRRMVFQLLVVGAGVGTYAAVASAFVPWGSCSPRPTRCSSRRRPCSRPTRSS